MNFQFPKLLTLEIDTINDTESQNVKGIITMNAKGKKKRKRKRSQMMRALIQIQKIAQTESLMGH